MATPSQLQVARELLGKPWAQGATGPAAYDCWGMVRHYTLHALGLVLPSVAVHAATADELHAAARHSGWHPVSAPPREHDIVLARSLETGGRHVGVVLDLDGLPHLLHCLGSVTNPLPGVVVERLSEALSRYHSPRTYRHLA